MKEYKEVPNNNVGARTSISEQGVPPDAGSTRFGEADRVAVKSP